MKIGVDFDNTLINYDDVMHAEAVERGFIAADAKRKKRRIRDAVRRLPDGDIEWQKLQASVYGSGIRGAVLMEGADTFLKACRRREIGLSIISHKSARYPYANGINFREAALRWMASQGFFDSSVFGFKPGDVLFEDTRRGKVNRIRSSGCTHFIDDLAEVFCEDNFPGNVEKILFERDPVSVSGSVNIRIASSWKEIQDYFFPAGNGS